MTSTKMNFCSLMICAIVIVLSGCRNAPPTPAPNHPVIEDSTPDTPLDAASPEQSPNDKTNSPDNKLNNRPPLPSEEKKSPQAALSFPNLCQSEKIDLEAFLTKFSEDMEASKIMYNSEPLSDCSGMFLRLCQATQKRCPDYNFPNPNQVRDSRMIGRWFHNQGNLKIIEDPLADSELIRPGAVMFYGHQNKKYENMTIESITASDGIEHVGVVTEVKRNAKGVITEYKLFHGRSTGKIAARSSHHKRKPSRKGLPPYGNWDQQWIAVGWLLTPAREL